MRTALITGGLMLLGGNSVLVWAEQFVPSGLAALLVATVPLWVVVISSVESCQRPATTAIAVVYLLLFGSLVGYSAYMWLVKETTAAQASSNFYVNPVIAVLLGWLLAGEDLATRTLVAMTVIVAAVLLIVSRHRNVESDPPPDAEGRLCTG